MNDEALVYRAEAAIRSSLFAEASYVTTERADQPIGRWPLVITVEPKLLGKQSEERKAKSEPRPLRGVQ
jgi:hypothetical protein